LSDQEFWRRFLDDASLALFPRFHLALVPGLSEAPSAFLNPKKYSERLERINPKQQAKRDAHGLDRFLAVPRVIWMLPALNFLSTIQD
jgi:hypothetical protein